MHTHTHNAISVHLEQTSYTHEDKKTSFQFAISPSYRIISNFNCSLFLFLSYTQNNNVGIEWKQYEQQLSKSKQKVNTS